MTRDFRIRAAIVLTLAIVSSAATAQRLPPNETRSLETKVGQAVLAYRFSALGPDCVGREPEIHVTKTPGHGKVGVKPESFEIGSVLDPSATQVCVGRRVQGLSIYSSPTAPLRGWTSLLSRSSCGAGPFTGPIGSPSARVQREWSMRSMKTFLATIAAATLLARTVSGALAATTRSSRRNRRR